MSQPRHRSRLLLQIVQGVLALLALATGVRTLWNGAGLPADALALPENQDYDSMLRFVGGIWLGIGAVLAWGLHRIEERGPLLRAAWAIVLCGGLGRLLSIVRFGASGPNFVIAAAVEIAAPVLLTLWQRSLVRPARALGGEPTRALPPVGP